MKTNVRMKTRNIPLIEINFANKKPMDINKRQGRAGALLIRNLKSRCPEFIH